MLTVSIMLSGDVRARRGVTAVELLVALTIAAVVLALFAALAVRQQRIFGDLADAAALDAHLRETASVVAVDLRSLAPALGDVRDARDTALEIRATIATAVVCDATPTTLILSPEADSTPRFVAFATPVAAGDTAWLLSTSDMSDDWRPLAIAAAGTAPPGQCAPLGPKLDARGAALTRTSLTVDRAALAAADPTPIGLPIRVTRPVRYSLYRASDGLWYLGERDWNAATLRFNTIQPLAGPLLPASLRGLAFTYLDRSGVTMASPVSDPSTIAFVRVDARGETANIVRALGAAGPNAPRRDSISALIAARGS